MDNKTLDIVPQSISGDKTVRRLCQVLDKLLFPIDQAAKQALIYSKIDTLPIEVIGLLAWQFHADSYDLAADDAAKRSMVKAAILDHRYKGTPWALTQAVRLVIPEGKIKEWQGYGGTPYRFKVTTGQGFSSANHLQNLLRSIANSKNVRSWLDDIEQEISVPATMYTSAKLVMEKKVTLYPADQTENSITTPIYIGIARQEQEEIEIRGDFSGSME